MDLEYRNTPVFKVRYTWEHDVLPKKFYSDPETVEKLLLGGDDENYLFQNIARTFKEVGGENPYTPDQFKSEGYQIFPDLYVIKVTYPTPEYTPLCHYAYLFFKEGYKDRAFFCLEKSCKELDDKPFLCAWFADGERRNYGVVEFDERFWLRLTNSLLTYSRVLKEGGELPIICSDLLMRYCLDFYHMLFTADGVEDKDKGKFAARYRKSSVESTLLNTELFFAQIFFVNKELSEEPELSLKAKIYDHVCRVERSSFGEEKPRFTENDFSVVPHDYPGDIRLLKLTFPMPVIDGQLYSVYFLFDKKYEKLACYGDLYKKELNANEALAVEFDAKGVQTNLFSEPIDLGALDGDRDSLQMLFFLAYCKKFGIGA